MAGIFDDISTDDWHFADFSVLPQWKAVPVSMDGLRHIDRTVTLDDLRHASRKICKQITWQTRCDTCLMQLDVDGEFLGHVGWISHASCEWRQEW